VQSHIARRKSVGPAQRPHGDVLRGPVANTGQCLKGVDGGSHIRAAMEMQPFFGHRLRYADNCGLPLSHDAKLAQRIAAGHCQYGRRGEKPRQFRPWGFNGLAELVNHTLGQRAGGCHGDLLAQYRAHSQLKAVQGARHPQAVTAGEAGVQHAVDGLRVGVQVKKRAHPSNHQRQHAGQRIADKQHQM